MFEETIKCVWCLEEKPEEEVFEGVCSECVEKYYTPELGIQFISDCKLEKEFYVEAYMDANCSEVNARLIDLCKAEFNKGLQQAKFQMEHCTPSQEFLDDNVWEYQILKDFVVYENAEAWSQWAVWHHSRQEHIVFAPIPAKVN